MGDIIKLRGLLIIAFFLVGLLIFGNASANVEAEEQISMKGLETVFVEYWENVTGTDAESLRNRMDNYPYWYGDGTVDEDEVSNWEEDTANYVEDQSDGNYYFYLDGERSEVESVECEINGAQGDTDSTKTITVHYSIELNFDNIDKTNAYHIFQRTYDYIYYYNFHYYSDSKDDMDVAFGAPASFKIIKAYNLDDAKTGGSTVTGNHEMADLWGITFTADSDSDGVFDDKDDFVDDPSEWKDTDGDTYGDNKDAFPEDNLEWVDTDGDGYGDNGDVFKDDSLEWEDSDGDDIGNNADWDDSDDSEWLDTDEDGYGDNGDSFPLDASEWGDKDSDGIGDNADKFPDNPEASIDVDADGYPDEWNGGTEPVTTNLKLDNQPYDNKNRVVQEEPLSSAFLIMTIVFGVLMVIFVVGVIVLMMLIKKKGENTPPAAQGPPPRQGPPPGQRPPPHRPPPPGQGPPPRGPPPGQGPPPPQGYGGGY
jgi:hypothetical protein